MFRQTFRIAADHPALPGHFPGRPVVPGVVLLDRVAAAFEVWQNRPAMEWPQVKFLSPLLPEEEAVLTLEAGANAARFTIERGAQIVATGTVSGAAS
ncbi:MAG TPA: hydroxymyristoyl-ACP dehydratase [Rudaea sp.]